MKFKIGIRFGIENDGKFLFALMSDSEWFVVVLFYSLDLFEGSVLISSGLKDDKYSVIEVFFVLKL